MVTALAFLAALVAGSPAATGVPAYPPLPSAPPGHEPPLPISVRSPLDLAFKAEAERQYLILNLMTSGRLAYEAGDFARAAREWEVLLKVPALPAEIATVVSPLLAEARRQRAATPTDPFAARPPAEAPLPAVAPEPETETPGPTTVAGTVSGGGAIGPGGTVLWLKRLDGPTPAPRPSRAPRAFNQAGKTFVPHVLAIPVGESVVFRNDDPYFHNVFSLSPGQRFDGGLHSTGHAFTRTFTRAGPVELLCNIHASMVAYLYVVDSAYYAQPRANGAFVIRNVPPGRYELLAWHESAASITKQQVKVVAGGVSGLLVRIAGDRAPTVVVPDKYGKPRQPQLGY